MTGKLLVPDILHFEHRSESEMRTAFERTSTETTRVSESGHARSIQIGFDDFICSAVERIDCKD